LYTSLIKELDNDYSKKTLLENYTKILIVMSPIIPHFSNECLNVLEKQSNLEWPSVIEEMLVEDSINYVVQINGKKRAVINSKLNISSEELMELICNDPSTKKYLENSKIKNKVFVPNRLINIII